MNEFAGKFYDLFKTSNTFFFNLFNLDQTAAELADLDTESLL